MPADPIEAHKLPCFLCGVAPARWNEPGIADFPDEMPIQLRALERRVVELERGDTSLEALRHELLHMCAMCQEMILDLDDPSLETELIDRLKYRIDLLRRHIELPRTGTAS